MILFYLDNFRTMFVYNYVIKGSKVSSMHACYPERIAELFKSVELCFDTQKCTGRDAGARSYRAMEGE